MGLFKDLHEAAKVGTKVFYLTSQIGRAGAFVVEHVASDSNTARKAKGVREMYHSLAKGAESVHEMIADDHILNLPK